MAEVGRREFLELSIGMAATASVAAARTPATRVGGQPSPRARPKIRTADGLCRSYLFTPAGSGRWPAAIFLMDGFGIRPTLFGMAQRLADAGYAVLLPDLYYRAGAYEPLDLKAIYASGNVREAVRAKFGEPTDNRLAAKDAAAFLAYLSGRPEVAGPRIGVTGYCMSGGIALSIAGTYPERVAAAASFHGGNLATDSAMSPHLLAPKMKGRIYVAGAEKDASYPPEQSDRLEAALTDAKVDHRCERYPGTVHGWTMADTPVYNAAAAEHHWTALLALFRATLG